MIRRAQLALALVMATAPISAEVAAADEDMRALLKQLSLQVAELKSKSVESDTRIRELEKSLAQEREENRQLAVVPPKPKTVVAAMPTDAVATKRNQDMKPLVTLGDTKGTFKIPGTDTSLGFGGYVKLDVNENSASAGANKLGDLLLFVPQIPLSDRGEDGQISFNARESRLWFKSFTTSKWGDIKTYLELDLYGSAESYTPRLRHAYGSFGNLLAGQTWTTFLNELALPDTLDFGSPVGTVLLRQPMIRWTQPFTVAGRSMELQVAAEAPNSVLWTEAWDPAKPETLTSPGADRYPDLLARFNYKPLWGNLSLTGMGRQIRYTTRTGALQEAWGGAFSLAGKIDVFDLDNIRFTMNYGDALGRYFFSPLEDAALAASGHMSLVTSYSAIFAYQHWWHKMWRSTVAYGFEQADQPAFVNQAMTHQAQSLHANLLWSPLSQATLGIEYIYGTRQLIDGQSGYLNRVQLSAKYNF